MVLQMQFETYGMLFIKDKVKIFTPNQIPRDENIILRAIRHARTRSLLSQNFYNITGYSQSKDRQISNSCNI